MVLNGMGFGGNVPRDGFRVGVVTSSYDPSRGGFAGIQTTLRMQGGTNLLQRSIHTTLDAPALQWTTPIASQLATRYGQQIFSGTLSGPVVLDHVFYSTAFQFQRRASGLTSLASADPTSLEALRISPDSVERLFAALSPVGIPVRTPGVPSSRQNTEARLAARIDWVPHPAPPPAPGIIFFGQNATQDTYYLQAGGTLRNNDGAMIGPTSVPSFGGEQTHRDGWAQFTSAKYLPKSILNETTISLSASTDRSAPYLDLPPRASSSHRRWPMVTPDSRRYRSAATASRAPNRATGRPSFATRVVEHLGSASLDLRHAERCRGGLSDHAGRGLRELCLQLARRLHQRASGELFENAHWSKQ